MGLDELLIQQNTIPDGETVSPVQERPRCTQSLSRILSHLLDMFRPGEPFIKGYPKMRSRQSPFILSAGLMRRLLLVRINCPVIGRNKQACDWSDWH
jgi:hypothetical protein